MIYRERSRHPHFIPLCARHLVPLGKGSCECLLLSLNVSDYQSTVRAMEVARAPPRQSASSYSET